MASSSITECAKKAEILAAKYKAISQNFPDVKVYYQHSPYEEYSSKLVNEQYTNFDFKKAYNALYVEPYYNLDYEFDGNIYTVKINSSPRRNRLAYIPWSYKNNKRTIKFSKFSFNLKKNQFKDEMLNECKTQIMSFIKEHPNCDIDKKNLEPRLIKLLAFI